MAIPESQLSTWSNQGATTTSASTYAAIKAAIEEYSFRGGARPEVYLQGSYGNHTNIRGDSDVDIVVQLNETFKSDVVLLSDNEREEWALSVGEPWYPFADFRSDVSAALKNKFGIWAVSSGTKSLKVGPDRHRNRLGADVVPCIQYRNYFRFTAANQEEFLEGMCFETDALWSSWIINYPKFHRIFGSEKNSSERTDGAFKRTIRVFKNARNRWNEQLLGLRSIEAPSYFIECLLYQVPDDAYFGSLQESFANSVTWLHSALRSPLAPTMLCQNDRVPLFGPGPDQWDLGAAREFVDAMIGLWREWR